MNFPNHLNVDSSYHRQLIHGAGTVSKILRRFVFGALTVFAFMILGGEAWELD